MDVQRARLAGNLTSMILLSFLTPDNSEFMKLRPLYTKTAFLLLRLPIKPGSSEPLYGARSEASATSCVQEIQFLMSDGVKVINEQEQNHRMAIVSFKERSSRNPKNIQRFY